MGDLHPLAHPISPAAPAGIHQPKTGSVLLHHFTQHLGIGEWMVDEEGRSETGREGRRGFGYTGLRSGEFGCVAREEVIHCLVRVQAGNGGKDSERVGGEEEDMAGMGPRPFQDAVLDMCDGVGRSRVLGHASVVIIRVSGFRGHDIFEHRSEADGIVDLGLVFRRKLDALCIATAFEVEDPALAPAMLVVTDQAACRVGGKGGFSGSGKAEEKGAGSIRPYVGGTMHRENSALRKEVVHY